MTGHYSYVRREPDENGNFVAQSTTIPFGHLLVLDFGGAERGWLQFRPFDDTHLVPLHADVPPQPEGDYVLVVRVQVLLQQFGLAQWTLGGVIAQNAIFSVYRVFQHAREAAEGKLPVCRLRPSRQIPIASRNGEMHNAPVVEIVDWTARDERTFGPRTVPPPLPLLSAAAAAPLLPVQPAAAAPSTPLTPPAANANDPFSGIALSGTSRPPF
jgi:hypothetical protein